MEAKQLLNNSDSFALYRYPGSKDFELIAQNEEKANTSFVFYPFEKSVEYPEIRISGKSITINGKKELQSLQLTDALLSKCNSYSAVEKAEYIVLLKKLIDELKSSKLTKLVLSRALFVEKDLHSLVIPLLSEITDLYPSAFVYLFVHPIAGIWIGASPETLLEGKQQSFKTMSLAGTKSTDKPSSWSEKEIQEQALVSEFILDQLAGLGVKEIRQDGPYDKEAGNVTHLCTNFEFDSTQSVEKLLNVLHPTPAVCGLPRNEAKQLIKKLETWDRAYYTGYCGTQDIQGNYRFFVNLRCAQLFKEGAKIYVGGGVLEDSNAEAEWLETEMKSKTILTAMKNL